ncbi:MAG: phosphatase PAP2 family protein [Sphingomonas sp.]|uniref:phosphatase PAP2 family protein n=1 Tax=Sphingomonas sp. TaxID=28214 RepID=UPI001AD256F5|nr:phosphatase PAP2 family protein [Sphingomonas sp.]MBN8848307.1 phosphatase PAP2 family protein [Sphingomonas sp.]
MASLKVALLTSSRSAAAAIAVVQTEGGAVAAPAAPRSRGYGWTIFAGLLASIATLAVLMHMAGLRIDPLSRGAVPYYFAAALVLALGRWAPRLMPRHGRALADCAEFFGLFTVISLLGATASYPIAALTGGMHDAALQRIDEALGFDWLAWYRLVADHRALQWLGLAAYRTIYLTPAILLGWYAWKGDKAAAHRFLMTFWLAAALTLALYPLMTAVGPLSYLWHGPLPYLPESEEWQAALIPALRAHQVHYVDLAQLRGLVSAPSFHTVAAVLYIRAAWPHRELRAPLVAVNAAMLLSTPVEGTHYLIDMILGAVVAVVAIVAVRWLMAVKAGPRLAAA